MLDTYQCLSSASWFSAKQRQLFIALRRPKNLSQCLENIFLIRKLKRKFGFCGVERGLFDFFCIRVFIRNCYEGHRFSNFFAAFIDRNIWRFLQRQ